MAAIAAMGGMAGMGADAPVAVIGAGIAGLVAARQLVRQGFAVEVFEAGPTIAGMAASHTDEDGFSYDLGAHFVTNRLVAAVGCGQWDVVHHYGEVVRLGDRDIAYPGGLLRRPRYVGAALRARLAGSSPPATAAAWFRRQYGAALADEIAIPLVEAWSGRPADQLSPAVGEKLAEGVLRATWLRAAGRTSRRAVAVGYCREQPPSAAVYHVYPRGGVAALCDALARDLGGRIHVNQPIERVLVEGESVRAVRVDGRELPVAAVVSTAPINRLADLVEGTATLDPFRALRFRPIRAVNLKLRGRRLLADTLTWTPHGHSFFRLSEATWSMPQLAPEGHTMILVELRAQPGDELWSIEDDALVPLLLRELEAFVPDIGQRYLGVRHHRLGLAYPVFELAVEASRRRLAERGTGIDNLVSIGRNGEFAHILMEDSYWRTVAAMSRLGRRLRGQAGELVTAGPAQRS